MNKNLLGGILIFVIFLSASGVPIRDDDDPCEPMECPEGETCIHITPMCAKGAAKCNLKAICIPSQYAQQQSNSNNVQTLNNNNAPRRARDLLDGFDPCDEMECENHEKCTSVVPFCPEDSICHPKGVCVAAVDELF